MRGDKHGRQVGLIECGQKSFRWLTSSPAIPAAIVGRDSQAIVVSVNRGTNARS